MPRLLRFSIANVLVALENPNRLSSSKHPLTVNVSKPKVLFKIKLKDSDDMLISGFLLLKSNVLEKRSNLMTLFKSFNFIKTGLKEEIGEKILIR